MKSQIFVRQIYTFSYFWPETGSCETNLRTFEGLKQKNVEIRWAVGMQPGGCQIVEFTDVGKVTNASCLDCRMSPGQKYYVTVEAENAAGLVTRASSNGSTMDQTAPGVPTVLVRGGVPTV